MQSPARYLVMIDSEGVNTALMFTADHRQVANFDAATEEVALMTSGLAPLAGASGPEWDRALAGHSARDRASAQVYRLDV